MKGSHSGQGTVKSEARKRRLKAYRDNGTRDKNRDRRMARVLRGLRSNLKIVQRDGIWQFEEASE